MTRVAYSTPPWRSSTVYDERSFVLRDADHRVILAGAVPSLKMSNEEARANRYVLEAATDTLLACEIVLEVLKAGRPVTPRIIQGLEAAVDKATGRGQ